MIWTLALIGAGLVCTALVLLLVLPVRLRAVLDGTRLRVALGVFGLPAWLPVYDSAAAPTAPAPGSMRRRGSGLSRRALAQGPRLALEALHRIRVDTCRVALRVGLGDPAQTGVLYGRLAPLVAARWLLPAQAVLAITPDFEQAVFQGDGELALSVVPARLIPVAVRSVWALRS